MVFLCPCASGGWLGPKDFDATRQRCDDSASPPQTSHCRRGTQPAGATLVAKSRRDRANPSISPSGGSSNRPCPSGDTDPKHAVDAGKSSSTVFAAAKKLARGHRRPLLVVSFLSSRPQHGGNVDRGAARSSLSRAHRRLDSRRAADGDDRCVCLLGAATGEPLRAVGCCACRGCFECVDPLSDGNVLAISREAADTRSLTPTHSRRCGRGRSRP
jgi:hypothetical protein